MKRRMRQIIVFLLLGAIVNVAVAWGFAMTVSHQYLDETRQEIESGATRAYVEVDSEAGTLFIGVGARLTHGRQIRWTTFDEAREAFQRMHPKWFHVYLSDDRSAGRDPLVDDRFLLARGWPVHTLWSELIYEDGGWTSNWQHGGVENPLQNRGFHSRSLPLLPIWPGFAINTVFYATILWLFFAVPGFVRRHICIKRGLCPVCAYPNGTSDVCTECGRAVK